MAVLDIHTHAVNASSEQIRNVIFGREPLPDAPGWFSVGMHPWYLAPDWNSRMPELAALLETRRDVVALGECGLDRLSSVPLELQMKVFEAHCLLSEQYRRPLILHVVKAHSEILMWRRRLSPAMPWVIHGFRGKPELARQYVEAGCYLSFGIRHFPETPSAVPLSRLLVETDEADVAIGRVVQAVAFSRQMPAEALSEQLVSNTRALFFPYPDCLLG